MNWCERELSSVSFGEGIIRVEEYCQKSSVLHVCPVCVVGI